MSDTHDQRVREAFTAQAPSFEDRHSNGVFTDESSWLFERVQCGAEDLLLDVAAGTGHVARAFAPRVRLAVASDMTEAMLEEGARAIRDDGPENVLFVRANAAELPFLDESFDIVLTRFALHHVEHPDAVVREMARCVRPGGQVAIGDLVTVEDRALAASQDHIEQLRDPSHTHALSVEELESLCTAAGLDVVSSEARSTGLALERWLEQAQTPSDVADGIRAQLQHELTGGESTGMEPHEHHGKVAFRQRWASVIARRPRP